MKYDYEDYTDDEEDYNNLDLTGFVNFLTLFAERKLNKILNQYKEEKKK